MQFYRAFVSIAVSLVASQAWAAPQPLYTFKLDGQPSQAPSCSKQNGADPKPDATTAYVKVDAASGIIATFTLDGVAITPTLKGGLYEIPLKSGAENALVVTPTEAGKAGTACDPVRLSKAADQPATNPDEIDLAAYNALQSKSLQDQLEKLRHTRGLPRHTKFLVHLPSGQPAFPFAATYTEGDTVQVVTLAPTNSPRSLELEISDCGAVNTFRTDIAVSSDDKKQGSDLANRFVLMPVGQYFSCGSGTVTYTLKAHAGDKTDADTKVSTTKLTFRPKYHVAAIAVLGWDTARRKSFTSETASGADMATVVARDEKIGSVAYVGAVWMIGGVDYEHMRPWNYVANLWIAADASSPTTDFATGLAITPTGGASIAIGLTFHEGNALEGLKVGDPFVGSGSVPTHRTWNGVDTGWIVGVSIDSRVYDAIIQRFSK